MLFNELMTMLAGDIAISRYVSQNVKQSGLEIWRKLHRNSDPSTYGTRQNLKSQIEKIAEPRAKDMK